VITRPCQSDDFAFTVAATSPAQRLLGGYSRIEYDPSPPFDSGIRQASPPSKFGDRQGYATPWRRTGRIDRAARLPYGRCSPGSRRRILATLMDERKTCRFTEA